VRVDSAVYQGYTIPPNYDSLVGKLIVHGRNRTEALMRLRRASPTRLRAGRARLAVLDERAFAEAVDGSGE
jgi:biotin carboxylase